MKSFPKIIGGGKKLSVLPLDGYVTAYPYGGDCVVVTICHSIILFVFPKSYWCVSSLFPFLRTNHKYFKHTVKAYRRSGRRIPLRP